MNLRCWVFGHEDGPWFEVGTGDDDAVLARRVSECERCQRTVVAELERDTDE